MQSVASVADESLEQALDFDALEAAFAGADGSAMRAACRAVLTRVNERLKQRFFGGAPVEEIVGLRAFCIDEIVRRAWSRVGPGNCAHALLAVGGYGRGELHPYSDVDICIVLGAALDDATRTCIEQLITFLWDIGLEVGHSVRTVDECAQAASGDITIMTNLMEARLLEGPPTLLAAVRTATANDRLWPTDLFFKAKMEEQERRHQRYNDAFQQLEPNIKESPGGLRDIQIIAWVANRHFHTAGLRGLIENGFLTAQEYDALVRGRNHLWRIRCALHYLAGRREDRLLFDYQRRVSEVFGFADESHNRAVEQFMRGFYRTVRELGRLNEMLLGLFQEAILHPDREVRAAPLNRRFQVRGNYIEVASDQVFRRTPPALLEIFLLIQRNPWIKGVRASTIRLIREHLNLIDDKFRRDIRARSLFMEIIRQPRLVGHELQRMHRYGVLSAYLPEFARIEGLMQFDLFHVYTVDEHLLFVLQMMRRFSYPLTEEDQPGLVRQAIERIPKLELLYIAGLYHDVGKGTGRDHSEVGAEEVTAFCRAHGLSNYDTNLVAWLVENHLVMSATAQREDIYDPDVVQRFAGVVAPTETKSTPARAAFRAFSIVIPPEASVVTAAPVASFQSFTSRTASRIAATVMLSRRIRSAPASSAWWTSSRVRASASRRHRRNERFMARKSAARRVASQRLPQPSAWLSFTRKASESPIRWFVPPPQRTAYFSRARRPGVVFRVSRSLVFVPARAST